MANKKVNELDVRASLSLSDLMLVGDPSSGYAYKTTLNDLKTLISTEADTLDSVTGRGNITSNAITIGAATINGSVTISSSISALNGLFNVGDYDTGSGGSNKASYIELKSYNNDGYGDGLSMQYSRGTVSTPAAVQTNDLLGGVYFKGYNGTNNQLLNYIEAIVTGYGTHPKTKLVFTTTNGNDTYSYISMILDPDGRLFLGYNVEDKGPSYRLQVDGGVWATGALVSSLVGTGTRMVVADATGVLSAQDIPTETITTNRQTASYSLVLTDKGKLIEMNVGSANNLTIPLNSSIAFPIGTKIDIAQYGAGQTTVVATSGVTLRSAGGALKLAAQYSGGSLVKIATDEWYLFGDITL